ncbi:unnamed protein product [Plutella xylostella]|uniref:(diamondback moth) hypothetical protein n=1 Tax=Plutella xylostella TaxID=51655 RepID=A0A8S4FV25_PLUXY|nr:unnamed protein product [Plutella xylostella]
MATIRSSSQETRRGVHRRLPSVSKVVVELCIPVLSYGTAMGWISPHKAVLMGPDPPSSLAATEEEVSWMASVIFISAPVAVFACGAAADRYGRRAALLAASVPVVLGWAIKLISSQPRSLIAARALIGFGSGGSYVVCPLYLKEISFSRAFPLTTYPLFRILSCPIRTLGWSIKLISSRPRSLIAARALIGFGSGGSYVVCPLYVKEISEDSIRGMTGTFIIFSQTVGNLLVFVLGDLLPYNTVLWILLAIPLLHFGIMTRLPETPSYLIKCGKNEETAKVLSWLRSLPADHCSIRAEVERLQVEQTSCQPKFSPRLLFADKTAVKAFWVALTVNLTREFCGCIAVLVYASHIFAAAGKDQATSSALSPNKQSIMLAAVQIIGSFVACQLVDRAGRKVRK